MNIGADVEEAVAHLKPFRGRHPDGSCEFSVSASGFGHTPTSIEKAGVVPLTWRTDGVRKVTGPEEKHIEAGNGGDRVEFCERFRIFDLDDHETVGVGLGEVGSKIEQAVGPVTVSAVYRSAAHGMESCHAGNGPGILGAHDMGDHDPGGVQFEGMQEVGVGAPGHTDEDIQIAGMSGEDLRFQGCQIGRGMFPIEPGAVEAEKGGDFDRAGAREVEFEGVDDTTGAESVENAAGAYGHGLDSWAGVGVESRMSRTV